MPIDNKEVMEYEAPFQELYFTHAKILDLARHLDDQSDEGQHLRVLINVLNELFAEIGPRTAQLYADKMITCVDLWTIFPKGMLVYARINDQDRIFEVVRMRPSLSLFRNADGHWTMKCRYVQFRWDKIRIDHYETEDT